jgi:hypothetical protein
MIHHNLPWPQATSGDLNHRDTHFPPIDALPRDCRKLMRRVLELDPAKRATIAEVRADAWFKSIEFNVREGSDCGELSGVAHPEALTLMPQSETRFSGK